MARSEGFTARVGIERLAAREGEQAVGEGRGAGRPMCGRPWQKRAMSFGAALRQAPLDLLSEPIMPCSRLLKSCAMPPVSWPTASIFCDCRNASWVRSRVSAASFSSFTVAGHGVDLAFVRRCCGPGHPSIRAILAAKPVLEPCGFLAACETLDVSARGNFVFRMQHPQSRAPDHLLLAPTQRLGGWPVHVEPDAWKSATTSRSCETFQMRSRSRVRAVTRAARRSLRWRSSISACLAAVMSWATPIEAHVLAIDTPAGCDSERSQRQVPSARR